MDNHVFHLKFESFAMAVHLNGKQFEITRDLFKSLDKDGDGKITVAEFTHQIMRAKKLEDDQSEDYSNFLFRIYDMDGNGCLEFPEFLQIHACITHTCQQYCPGRVLNIHVLHVSSL